jgi:hypothetical protein
MANEIPNPNILIQNKGETMLSVRDIVFTDEKLWKIFKKVLDFFKNRKGRKENSSENRREKWPPLCEAIYGRQKQAVELLLKRGANANAVTHTGLTPLIIARLFRCIEIIPVLKKHGAH